ncbi:MAG: hypothetical protein ACK47B_19195 [Armatimonadota bacterium]
MLATAHPELSPEERRRSRALDILKTHALETILESDEPLRTVDLARMVADRLQLDLNEEELGGLAAVVRLVLDSDPMFSQANRQWDLALRMGRAEGDRRKPVERAVEDFIDLLGHPALPQPVSVLVAAVYGRTPDYYERMIERIAGKQEFVRLGQELAISRWNIEITSDEPEDVEEDNFSDTSLLDAARSLADGVSAGSAADYAAALVKKAGEPLDNRVLQYLAWREFPDLEPAELFAELYGRSDVVLERGPAWTTRDDHQAVIRSITSLTGDPEATADLVATTAEDLTEETTGILAATTVRVSDDDLNQVEEHLQEAVDRTFTVTELCQQVLEAFPGSRTYAGVHESLLNRMREDGRFLWVGWERFRLAGSVPPEFQALPEGLAFDDREYLDENGEPADRILPADEWKGGLDEQVQHYLVQDVGDDVTAPGTPDRLVSSPPLHHYVAGTRYLRNSDRGFFPNQPDLVLATLRTGESRFDVWVNNRLGLIFGLKEWYDANLPWVGGSFVIVPSEQSGEYELSYNGETEPLMDIPLERLQQLLALRAEAQSENLPWTELVTRLLKDHPEGVHFVTLFTELNVVRRARRGLLAGILSSQRFFSTTGEGLWIYDEKRAQKTKGKKKAGPRRPAREMYDEEEDEFEYE